MYKEEPLEGRTWDNVTTPLQGKHRGFQHCIPRHRVSGAGEAHQRNLAALGQSNVENRMPTLESKNSNAVNDREQSVFSTRRRHFISRLAKWLCLIGSFPVLEMPRSVSMLLIRLALAHFFCPWYSRKSCATKKQNVLLSPVLCTYGVGTQYFTDHHLQITVCRSPSAYHLYHLPIIQII